MSKLTRGIVAICVTAVLALGQSPATAADEISEPNVSLEICKPGEATFTLNIDNPYFPLTPGQVSVFFGVEEDPEEGNIDLGLRIAVLDETKTLYKGKSQILTRVVEETEWVDADADGFINDGEELIEVSRNYFAQTLTGQRPGTVCYFGEEVKIYDDGRFRGDRSGSWRADAKGNAPGIFMPSNPQSGEVWEAEAAPGIAEDRVEVTGFGKVDIPDGPKNVDSLEVQDCNPLEEPIDCGDKTYAYGFSLFIDGPVELTRFTPGTASASKAKKR